MSTRASNARHVRQRKLNTKSPLRIIPEDEVDDALDDESQRHIPQVETGVEKGEEVEFHLQVAINASLGPKTKPTYIPTPETVKAKDVDFDALYPKIFSQPASYIRFSSTVEDCVGSPYCMNEDDFEFLTQLNDGKDVNGQPLKVKSSQCPEETFEEVVSFFEESTQRLRPFSALGALGGAAELPTLDEMNDHRDEDLSQEAQRFIKPIYQYWYGKKGVREMMPAIKVRVLDTNTEADDADPYVCFRRREVRQTRKTRGRDAQVVDKLKKLRLELESARQLVQMIKEREELNKQNLEISRKVFEQRKQLKEVKIAKSIVGEKGEDEELLVNQKPVPKPKTRGDGTQQRLPTLRLRSTGVSAPDTDLTLLSDLQTDAEALVNHTIESRKDQHRKWNLHWQDRTWDPLTPPPETAEDPPKWAPLFSEEVGYPTPPPSLPSRSSQDLDGDVEMLDQKPILDRDTVSGAESRFTFFVAPPCPVDGFYDGGFSGIPKRNSNPACRIRYGRGGRMHLEVRKEKPKGIVSRAVVSDSESDDETDYHPVSEQKTFDYRCALHIRPRPGPEGVERRQWPSGDQTAMMAGLPHFAGGSSRQLSSGSAGDARG